MNFFRRKTSWTNAELIPLKLSIAAAYVLVGACFHDFIMKYTSLFVAFFLITVVWALYLWISKMKRNN